MFYLYNSLCIYILASCLFFLWFPWLLCAVCHFYFITRLLTHHIPLCQYSYIDDNKGKFIANLSDAVAIKSVSCWADHRQEYVYVQSVMSQTIYIIITWSLGTHTHRIFRMVKWTADKLNQLGVTTELKDLGKQVLWLYNLQLNKTFYNYFST